MIHKHKYFQTYFMVEHLISAFKCHFKTLGYIYNSLMYNVSQKWILLWDLERLWVVPLLYSHMLICPFWFCNESQTDSFLMEEDNFMASVYVAIPLEKHSIRMLFGSAGDIYKNTVLYKILYIIKYIAWKLFDVWIIFNQACIFLSQKRMSNWSRTRVSGSLRTAQLQTKGKQKWNLSKKYIIWFFVSVS